MIVVQNRVRVAEGFEEAVLDRFRTRRGLVDSQPGFVRNLVLRPGSDPSRVRRDFGLLAVLFLFMGALATAGLATRLL